MAVSKSSPLHGMPQPSTDGYSAAMFGRRALRFRTWPVAALGLVSLVVLVAASVLTASRRTEEIYSTLDRLGGHHRDVEAKLRRLRSDVHLSGIFVRDYLLDTSRERAPEYRQRLAEFRRTNLTTLDQLIALAARRGESTERIRSLQEKLEDYWAAFDPIIDWTIGEKINRSASFLRKEVIPRREAVLTIAQEIEALNNTNLTAQRAEVTRQQVALSRDLHNLLWRSLLLGALVAVLVVIRLRVVERRSDEQTRVAQEAERRMRELSLQVVAAQEDERRKLSRELHDHVGQMLTALRMELGHVDRLRSPFETRVAVAVVECRRLVDEMVGTVRDLALGLRPTMLDDFGLTPALEWHARDFTRRCGIPVEVSVDGELDDLSDHQRTCVYRVVQEALTNCARHAKARRILLRVERDSDTLTARVIDDGIGLGVEQRRAGLGLRGMEERAREAGGILRIDSAPGAGATVTVHLPLKTIPRGAEDARAAG
jgi:signal transduction histidine kinase